MQKLSTDINRQQEILTTKKYVLSKFPDAVVQKLPENGEEVYQVKAGQDKFPTFRFIYDRMKAQYFVRPYTRLKRKGKPDIIIYSTLSYPASHESIIQILNDAYKTKKFIELPNAIQVAEPIEVRLPTASEQRMLSILGQNTTHSGHALRRS